MYTVTCHRIDEFLGDLPRKFDKACARQRTQPLKSVIAAYLLGHGTPTIRCALQAAD